MAGARTWASARRRSPKAPPALHEIVRVPVDDEGGEMEPTRRDVVLHLEVQGLVVADLLQGGASELWPLMAGKRAGELWQGCGRYGEGTLGEESSGTRERSGQVTGSIGADNLLPTGETL
jgi:hypothetical protein